MGKRTENLETEMGKLNRKEDYFKRLSQECSLIATSDFNTQWTSVCDRVNAEP